MNNESSFKAAWWLSNAHAQTMYSIIARNIVAPINHTERLELEDGDFIDLAWASKGLDAQAPLVILLHGLGGNVHSKYIAGLMHAFNSRGWRAVLMHFRGASQEPNRLARAYHSGETSDLNSVLNVLEKREPHTKKAVVGISLGGNVLLKWLGEQGNQSLIQTAVAVSVPFQLRLIADKINQGLSRVYQVYLLKQLRRVFALKWNASPNPLQLTLNDLDSIKCFWTFDERVTAPLHGFSNVHEYYRKSSSRQYLNNINTPTLIIHSLDDPFMTPQVLPTADELSPHIKFELSQKGGHVGFISGQVPGKPIFWLDHRIPDHLQEYL